MVLFFVYVAAGAYLLSRAVLIRYSPAGRVCSGDFLKKSERTWQEHKDYFMRYEGNFITILFALESLCFFVMSSTFLWVLMTR